MTRTIATGIDYYLPLVSNHCHCLIATDYAWWKLAKDLDARNRLFDFRGIGLRFKGPVSLNIFILED